MTDELSNATRIAALEEQVRRLTAELEQYRMRLAGALIASEGGDGHPSDALEYLRTCPTITSVMKFRQALDRERERCGVLEREVKEWRECYQDYLCSGVWGNGGVMLQPKEVQATDTRHALDAAKFVAKSGCGQ